MNVNNRLKTASVTLLVLMRYASCDASEKLTDLALEELMGLSLSSITRMSTKLESSPVTAYVVTQQEINKKGYRYLIDILKNTPGIYVVENSLPEKAATEIYIRGILSNSKMLVLVDGHRIKPATGEPMSFFSSLPLLNIKQVEISIGAGASLYGADAMTATVNLVTQDGQDYDGVRSKVTVGTRDTAEIQFAAGKSLTEHIDVALSGSFQHSKGEDFSGNFPEQYQSAVSTPDMEDNNYSVQFKANIDRLTVSYYRVETKRNSGLGLKPDVYDVSGASFLKISNQVAAANYEWDITPFWQMKTQFAYEHTRLDPESRYTGVCCGLPDYHVTWNSSSTRFTQNLAYQKGPVHWIGGFEFMHLSTTPKKDIEMPFGEYHSSYQNYAVFTQLQVDVLTDLTVMAGLRLDIDSRYDEELNPRVGFSWKASPQFRLFGSWGTSYLSPSPYLIYERFNEPNPIFYKRPNENLESEHLMSVEFGGEWEFIRSQKIKLLGFYTKGSDLIREVRVSQNDGLRINDNNDEHEIYGLETGLHSQLFSHLSLDLAYTLTLGYKDAGNLGDGDAKISHFPVNLMHGALVYDVQPFTLRFSGRWFDQVYSHPKNEVYEGEAANGTAVFDVNLHYQARVNKLKLDMDVTVDNVFNEKYHKLSTIDGNSFAGLAETPQQSRRIFLTVGVAF